ncbi:MAG: hypothetical protein HS129_05095 [Leptospiraceae bacterium]|nr:hypothetical protein [Leptospiraceae bacterium]
MGSMADAVTRATGGYAPTGIYSLEFLTRSSFYSISVGEYFFLLGLERMDQSYNYKISVKPTYGGTAIVDNGNSTSDINLSGQFWGHYTGAPVRKPMGGLLGIAGAALGELEKINPFKKSGFLDFLDLVYLMQEIRDEDKVFSRVPGFSFFYPTAFDIFSESIMLGISSGGFNFEDIQMVFHDYDRDAHWEVVFATKGGFKISQSKDDPFTYLFSLSLIGVKDVSTIAPFRRAPLPDPKSIIRNVLTVVNDLFSDLSEPLKYLSSVADLYKDIASLAESLKKDLRVFEPTNKENIRALQKAGGPIRKKCNQFQELVTQLFFAGQTTPSLAGIDQPSTPLTTSSSPAEIAAGDKGVPESLTDNVLTDPTGAGNEIETDIALDQTMQDVVILQMEIENLNAALILLENSNLSQNFTYQELKPGMTLENIAIKYYGSVGGITQLIQDNGKLFVGKKLEELYGQKIRIPSKKSYNMVDTGVITEQRILNESDSLKVQETLESWYFGEDLALTDATRDIEVKNGDIGTTVGLDCLVDNTLDKMRIMPGQIPAHPDIGAMEKPGSVPDNFLNLVIPKKILQNIESDLGVQTASITSISVDADKIEYTVQITPIGGFKTFKLRRVRGIQD